MLLSAVLAVGLSFSFSGTAQVVTTKPIRVKQPKTKTEKYKGVVVNWTPVSVTVRPSDSFTRLRTFSFSEALQRKVENRYLESGERVTVHAVKGTDMALKLGGKLHRRESGPRVLKK